ncbi:MAG: cadherin-like domain-containing protein [Gammaproteobacteria bacterium]|nr:cadherin-like domain-containing protein [Gammaproteobacteria bacterium]
MKSPLLNKKSLLPLLIASSLTIAGLAANAEPGKAKHFGAKAPFKMDELPNGKLKNQLKGLSKDKQQKAMQWLHKFTFPANDVAQLNVDKLGNVYYNEPAEPQGISQQELEANPSQAGISNVDAFKLHSKPGAANTVYLNFKGETIVDTVWNDSFGSDRYDATAFDLDGNPTSYSEAERAAIAEVWHRVAEDLAPFDINVTTERPASFGPNVGHVLITGKNDANGQAMPGGTGGGYAYVGVWGIPNYEWYQPALVYYQNLSSPTSYAEAATHEFGHHMGLSHHGTSTKSYYYGHGSGMSSWAPIMGVGYNRNVTQWSNGNYADANNAQQDDLAVISEKLSYRSDDHPDSLVGATPLLVDGYGQVASSNPEIDPDNQRTENKGIISNSSDKDVFSFDTNTGSVNITINPAWDAYTRDSKRGVNLDIKATITDGYGMEIVSDDMSDTNAILSAQVAPGRYYLTITGVGNNVTPYNDYGSMGQYFISGSVESNGTETDTTAPTPNTMDWAMAPSAISSSAIEMEAIVATDDSGQVEYQFICTAGGANCNTSTWQSGTYFKATGLDADTDYSFQVKARDMSGNETLVSYAATSRTYTDSNTAPTLNSDSIEVLIGGSATINVLANDSDLDGDYLKVVSVTAPSKGAAWVNGDNTVSYQAYGNKRGGDSFTYTVSDGKTNATATVNVSLVRSLSSGGSDGGTDDGTDTGGKCHPKKGC